MVSVLDDLDPGLLEVATPAERALLERAILAEAHRVGIQENDWEAWAHVFLAHRLTAPFGDHHRLLWDWAWTAERDCPPNPSSGIGCFARGGAKSGTAEAILAGLGATGKRGFALYVCGTQSQANDHVIEFGDMIAGSPALAAQYPEFTSRKVGEYGTGLGWSQSRLRCANGFSLDAIGLDKGTRGLKFERRPDLIVVDDVDTESDTRRAADRKYRTLSRKILGLGQPGNTMVLFVQNVIHRWSVLAQLLRGELDMMRPRITVGPVPALEGCEIDDSDDGPVIVAGDPTWEGQNVEDCQAQLGQMGRQAFLAECQHDVAERMGGLFEDVRILRADPDEVPDLAEVTVWVDPAVSSTSGSSSQGICCVGAESGRDGTLWVLWASEAIMSPLEALMAAGRAAIRWGATTVGVETDQGGDTWRPLWRQAWRQLDSLGEVPAGRREPMFAGEKAGGKGSKIERAQRWLLPEYESPVSIVHVRGEHTVLEDALSRFGVEEPFDLVDSLVWAVRWLRRYSGSGRAKVGTGRSGPRVPTGQQAVLPRR